MRDGPYCVAQPGGDLVTMSGFEPWEFRPEIGHNEPTELVGYLVMGTDGEVGEVEDTLSTAGRDAFIVDTGAWVIGQRILLPVGTIDRIDHREHRITVDRSIAEIIGAPPYDPVLADDPQYGDELADYYCNLYGGGGVVQQGRTTE